MNELGINNNISMDNIKAGRVKVPKEDDFDFGDFTKLSDFQPFEYFCYDCKKYKLGNILWDSKTRKLIFVCGNCFEKRIENKRK